jgi:hypothetical protein
MLHLSPALFAGTVGSERGLVLVLVLVLVHPFSVADGELARLSPATLAAWHEHEWVSQFRGADASHDDWVPAY